VLFRSPTGEGSQAQIEAFEDTWHWNEAAERAFDDVMSSGNSDAAEMLRAMRSFLKENDMMAYLAMMAVRLLELHRVRPLLLYASWGVSLQRSNAVDRDADAPILSPIEGRMLT